MNKPLSLVLIEQLFSFMIPLGFTTYQIELDTPAFSSLMTILIIEKNKSGVIVTEIPEGISF